MRASGQSKLTCAVNVFPPNPGSDAFHARLAFTNDGYTPVQQELICEDDGSTPFVTLRQTEVSATEVAVVPQ